MELTVQLLMPPTFWEFQETIDKVTRETVQRVRETARVTILYNPPRMLTPILDQKYS